jgi:amidase
VDFAIGTDCGGSVRVPAAYCGLFGIRPTHGRIPLDGVARFAPRFDTVGWFGRDAAMLKRVGEALLGPSGPQGFDRVLIAADAFEPCDPLARPLLDKAIERLGPSSPFRLSPIGLDRWLDTFRTVQAWEVWQSLGGWINRVRPSFGDGVGQRLAAAEQVGDAEAEAARQRADAIAAELDETIGDGLVLLPTTPGPAPLRSTGSIEIENAYRRRAMQLLCPAGLGGLPQLTIPVGTVDGAPVGLSITARRGKDTDLLDLAARAFADLPTAPDTR